MRLIRKLLDLFRPIKPEVVEPPFPVDEKPKKPRARKAAIKAPRKKA